MDMSRPSSRTDWTRLQARGLVAALTLRAEEAFKGAVAADPTLKLYLFFMYIIYEYTYKYVSISIVQHECIGFSLICDSLPPDPPALRGCFCVLGQATGAIHPAVQPRRVAPGALP